MARVSASRSAATSRVAASTNVSCLDFPNTGDKLGPLSFALGATYSVCFWANIRSVGSGGRIFDISGDLILVSTNNIMTCQHQTSNKSSADNFLTLSSWHFYCVTYDGSNLRFYRDGSLFGSPVAQASPHASSAQNYTFFNRADGLRPFEAYTDDFRYYKNRVLTAGEISSLYTGLEPSTTGLSIFWKFNEGSGSYVKDSSGLGNHTTLTGADWITASLPYTKRFRASSRSGA